MSAIVVSGDTSGAVTLDAPTVAGTVTVTLPAASGTMVVTGSSPSLADVTATGNLSVSGNTTLGDASTDTVLMTGAPSIGGAGYGMGMGFRNRIINGAMMIDQRNAGASVTANNVYTLDRWQGVAAVSSKYSVQQTPSATETGYAVRVASGFTNYLASTSLSEYTVGASEQFVIRQVIEGLNISDLAWGTASAKTITISALVYSSLTGTFGGSLYNNDGSRSYPFTYSIPVDNTWTTISVTIAGDTSGTWLTTNGTGIYVGFAIGAGATVSGTAGAWSSTLYRSATGAVSVVGTNGATFYITGVQLEKGATATSFDYRPYGTELALCQRYYWQLSSSDKGGYVNSLIYQGWADTATSSIGIVQFPVTMRTAPTVSTSGTVADYVFRAPQSQGISPVCDGVPTISSSGTNYVRIGATTSSTFTVGAGHYFSFSGNTTGYVGFSSEL